MVKTWKADLVFPYLLDFYLELESLLGAKIIHHVGIYHPFKSLREQNDWESRMGADQSDVFGCTVVRTSQYPQFELDPHGGTVIPLSGFVDLPRLMLGFRDFLRSRKLIVEEKLDPNRLELENGRAIYQGISARKILFCDGIESAGGELFNWLPLHPVKGEILTIHSDAGLDRIINRGVFILPQGNDKYKIGATYNWEDTSYNTTDSARLELILRLNQLAELRYEVVDQVAGIRPTSRDRRPFIGIHPEFEQIGVFNGLGTKGVSLAPYFSDHFIDSLEQGSELDAEVNISRYFSLYSRQ